MKMKLPKLFSKKSNDFILRIYAVVLAVLIWFIMSITLFPEMYKTIENVPVSISISGTDAERNGFSPINFSGTTVDVQIKGKRYEIGNYKKDDLHAEVIVTGITKSGEFDLNIRVVPKDNNNCDVVSVSPSTVKVKFDSYIYDKEFQIIPEAPNIKAANGFIMESLICQPSTVKISGAKSDIQRIDKVVVRTNSESVLSESQSLLGTELILYDGDTVLDKQAFTFNTDNFSVEVPIYMKKTLPFTVGFQNYPRNFNLSSLKYTLSYDSINIAAPKSYLENRDEYHLGYIDLSKTDLNNYSFDFPINLDTGYRNLSGFDTVTITLDTSELASKNVSIVNSQIHVINSPSRFDVKVQTIGISNIKLIGPSEIISQIAAGDVIAEVDLLGVNVSESTYSVPVKIYCPEYDTVWSFDTYNVAIQVTEKNLN